MLYHFRASILAILFSSVLAVDSFAGAEDGLFQAAKIIYESAQQQTDDQKLESYQRVRGILDQIVSDYEASDLAVRILLQDTIEGIDVAKLDEFLRDKAIDRASVEPVPSEQTEEIPAAPDESVSVAARPSVEADPAPPEGHSQLSAGEYRISDATTEKALELEKDDVRDLQARLLVSGHDPNGVDGTLGPGTRAAIRSWQASIGAVETGFMSAELFETLREETEVALNVWLQDSENAQKYKPPPPITLGPGNMSGRWSYVTNCGTNSKFRQRMRITGVLSMTHAGGQNYSGTLSNSQGLRGRVRATLQGRSVSAVTNFGLLIGKVSLKARVDDQQLVLRGRDSNGCSFYASK